MLRSFQASPDIDAVTTLLEETARTLVLPRFTRLGHRDVQSKAANGYPHDVVTVVDHEVEARLTAALAAMDPAASVIGEEAAHRQPGLLRLVESDAPIWILDPLDGTRNFIAGGDAFGLMLAWAIGGRTRAAWIVLPARGQTFVAEAGSGSFLNGSRATAPPVRTARRLRGALSVRYMPRTLGDAVTDATRGRFEPLQTSGCAAVDYTDIVRGEREFGLYYRLLPWDHAAPALILTEAGGRVLHLDGSTYSVRSANQPTIVAASPQVADQVRGWLGPTAAGASKP